MVIADCVKTIPHAQTLEQVAERYKSFLPWFVLFDNCNCVKTEYQQT